MQLTSPYFIYFLTAVTLIYWTLPRPARSWLLLVASYAFYATWSRWGLAFLIGQTLATYIASLGLSRPRPQRTRQWILFAGMLPTLGMLLFVKYFEFATATIQASGIPWHLTRINFINVA